MAIIDDIKCPRCDRKYSGVRSRCPYCGARRVGFGKYSKDNDNSKGKMLISILILAVFTVAAGAMLLSTPEPVIEATPEPEPISVDDVLGLPGFETPTPSPTPEATPTPKPEIAAIAVKHTNGEVLRFGNDISIDTATYDLAVFVEPPNVENIDIRLESDNEDIFTVDWLEGGVRNGFRITAVSKGNANLIVSVSDENVKDVKIIVRIV